MRTAILLGVLLAAACTVKVDKELPAGAKLSCTSAGDCPSEMTCDTGTGLCVEKGATENGFPCGTGLDCASGVCEHGTCCSSTCAAEGYQSCGMTGFCETTVGSPRFGRCAFFPAGTACHDATCSGGQYTLTKVCSGTGAACPDAPLATCDGSVPCLNGSVCSGPCTLGTTTGCATGFRCVDVSGTPTCRAENGYACVGASDCASGVCVGTTCCATSCADGGAASCGQTGACDSTVASPNFGKCAVYPTGTACRGETCAAAQFTTPQVCAGNGTACPGPPAPCAGSFACADTAVCGETCVNATSTGCIANHWCHDVGGVPTCGQNFLPNGNACASSFQCASGHCANGYCCGSATFCCNGDSASCPGPSAYCSGCSELVTTWTCDPGTFECVGLDLAGNDSACDVNSCFYQYCNSADDVWMDCNGSCSAGSCSASCYPGASGCV